MIRAASVRHFRILVGVGTPLHDDLCDAVDECEGWIRFGDKWCFVDAGGTQPDLTAWEWALVERGVYGDA